MNVVTKQKPVSEIFSEINGHLGSSAYDPEMLVNFLNVLEGIQCNNGSCTKKSYSLSVWGIYDNISLTYDGDKYSWVLSNRNNSDIKTFELTEWEEAYNVLTSVIGDDTSGTQEQLG